MSSMLEQAIIDAGALREAALKSAEQAVVEKYAPEIKAAMASLLENDNARFSRGQVVRHEGRLATITVENDDGRVGIQEIEGGKTYLVQESDIEEANEGLLQEEDLEEGDGEEAGKVNEAPLAAIDLEQEGIEEGEQIIFEFTADDFLEEEEKGAAGSSEEGTIMGDLEDMGDEETHTAMDAGDETGAGATGGETTGSDDVVNLTEDDEDQTLQELINILNEFEEDKALEEELVVDMKGEHKDGTFQSDEETLKYYQAMQLAKEESTKYKEENEALNKKLEELDEGRKRFTLQNKKLKSVLNNLNEKLQSTLLSNAKLLYSNRALNDASLNERQKIKIVEAIAKSKHGPLKKPRVSTMRLLKTQWEAKLKEEAPKSLSESVNRKSNLSGYAYPDERQAQQQPANDFAGRMQKRLAGIK